MHLFSPFPLNAPLQREQSSTFTAYITVRYGTCMTSHTALYARVNQTWIDTLDFLTLSQSSVVIILNCPYRESQKYLHSFVLFFIRGSSKGTFLVLKKYVLLKPGIAISDRRCNALGPPSTLLGTRCNRIRGFL